MMNMVYGDKEAEQYFITDIEQKDESLVITHADKSVEELKYTDHNLSFYRSRMIDQAKTHVKCFGDTLSLESFKVYVKRVATIIAGIVGLYFLYNFDIHILMKIILTILLAFGELAYYLFNEVVLDLMSADSIETLATEYYLAHLQDFQYYDSERGIDGYILPPEDIGKHRLDQKCLEQMSETIKDFKSQGFEDKEIYLTYKRETKTNPNVK